MQRKVCQVRDSLVALCMLGAIMIAQGSSAVAQTPQQNFTLSVRPHEMATATRTAQGGKQTLDGEPMPLLSWGGAFESKPAVYVPPQCVGARRCPLVLLVNAPEFAYTQISEKYGMILARLEGANDTTTVALLNQEMETVLRTFAIDPNRIAIAGSCCWFGHRHTITRYAAYNPNIFSLVASATQEFGDPPTKAPNQRTEYLLTGGLLAASEANFWGVQRLRDRGYAVTHQFEYRHHGHTYEGYDFIGHWLQQAWAISDPAARPVPYTFGDPPLLTEEILLKMTAFWARFMLEPDSIKTTARRAAIREVLIPVGKKQISSWMENISALASQYPSVAAALSAAQLTPQEHEAYRAALVSTLAYKNAFVSGADMQISADSVSAFLGVTRTSAVAKNLKLMSRHQDQFNALSAIQMWKYPPPRFP